MTNSMTKQFFPNEYSTSLHSQYTTISEPHWSGYHHHLCERHKVKRIAQVQSSLNQLDNVYAPFTPHYHFYIQEGNILQQLNMNAPSNISLITEHKLISITKYIDSCASGAIITIYGHTVRFEFTDDH